MGSAAKFLDSLLFDMQHDHFLKKLTLDQFTPSPRARGLGGSAAKFRESFLFDMQHKHVLKS